ncbi:hypothetical protein BN12_60039 [Nostocoides japonicum T1-X7]|uniref:Uncharacterized protein n=1 Tax=Nostocoides japonicum T1-X7 TaxID=1194083 RepID=A0A077M0K9_9MICO|nr:hypothetical protein BN12_60039 [Tetrasphaera japonica T1-X7]
MTPTATSWAPTPTGPPSTGSTWRRADPLGTSQAPGPKGSPHQSTPRRPRQAADQQKRQVPPGRLRLSLRSSLPIICPGARRLAPLRRRAPGQIRTADTRFRRAVLYPLSYGGGGCAEGISDTHRRPARIIIGGGRGEGRREARGRAGITAPAHAL